MKQQEQGHAEIVMTGKDTAFSTAAGVLIGLLLMPTLRSAKPEIYDMLKFWLVPLFTIGTPFGLYIAYLFSKKLLFLWQFAKFFVTGVMNALVDLGTLSLMTFLFRQNFRIEAGDVMLSFGFVITFYSLYKATSFIIANVNSYYWNKFWTFHKGGSAQTAEFAKFFIVSVIGFVINVIVASIVFGIGKSMPVMNSDQWGLIGAAAGSVAGLFWNFIGYKFVVFKK